MNLTQVPISMIDTAAGDAGKVLTSDGTSWSAASKLTSGTAATLTNQASVTFSVPTWVKRITVMMHNVSFSNSIGSYLGCRIGSGSVETTGYSGFHASLQQSSTAISSHTDFFVLAATSAAAANTNGVAQLVNIAGNVWLGTSVSGRTDTANTFSGSKTTTGVVDTIQLYAASGGTFDAGTVNIMWE